MQSAIAFAVFGAFNSVNGRLDFWRGNVDSLLSFQGYNILQGKGSVSNADMEKYAKRITGTGTTDSLHTNEPDVPVPVTLTTSNHNKVSLNSAPIAIVSYRLSTSNHNDVSARVLKVMIVSYRLSTSNHNHRAAWVFPYQIVSYRLSTSNHN